jgi:hypothetical protein
MTYPQGPYGQGFPGQPGYPQQPGYPPGYPAQPVYQQGYPPQVGYPGGFPPGREPPASSGGVGGVIAGVLSIMGGLLHGGMGSLTLVDSLTKKPDPFTTRSSSHVGDWFLSMSVIGGLLILAGGFMLLSRKPASRWLIGVGCVPIFAFGLGAFLAANADGSGVVGVVALPIVIFSVATVVLTFLPSTTRWIRAKRNLIAPQYFPQYPPPHQG